MAYYLFLWPCNRLWGIFAYTVGRILAQKGYMRTVKPSEMNVLGGCYLLYTFRMSHSCATISKDRKVQRIRRARTAKRQIAVRLP